MTAVLAFPGAPEIDTDTDPGAAIDAALAALHGNSPADVELATGLVLACKALAEQAASPWREHEQRARSIIMAVIDATGISRWRTDAGSAYVAAPSVRVTYDARALDTLCADDPALAARLAPHRRETAVSGALTVKP